jgi:N-acetylneuraminic acid mutarotase
MRKFVKPRRYRVRAVSVLLGLTVCLSLGATTASNSSDAAPVPGTAVKLYTGLYGSNDFMWGTTETPPPIAAWQVHSEMPNRMMDNVAATDGNHVYVAAGYNIGQVFYRHAVGSTNWETMTQCPMYLTTGGAAIIGDTFYYCGGFEQMSTAADTLLKYSISGNNWTAAPGPYAGSGYNWSPTVVACAGKLYYCSGCAAAGADNPTTQVWCYTPGVGWAQVASMNQGRVFAHGVSYHDTIWIAGGNANNVGLSSTEFYDPVADTWVVDNGVFPSMPSDCWAGAAGVTADRMFVAAGVKASAISSQSYVFDFTTRAWTTESGMPLAVYRTAGCGTSSLDAIVYGGSTGSFNMTDTVQVQTYAPPVATDVGCTQILAPPTRMDPGAADPLVLIRNFGTEPQVDFEVTCWIDSAGTRVYDNSVTWTDTLQPGATDSVTFPTWTSGNHGTYDVTMFTDLATDSNRTNDTITRQTAVNSDVLTWDTLTPAPSPGRYWCPGTGVYRDTLWFLGGRMSAQVSTRSIVAYDITSGTWISSGLPSLNTPRRAGGGGRIGNKIYVVGGRDSTSMTLSTCEEFDLDAKTSTAKANMPVAAWAVASAAAGNKLYLVGNESNLGTTYEYDPVANTWTTKAVLSVGRGWACAAGTRNLVYVMGGSDASGNALSDCWCFNPAANQWTQKANMPGPRMYSMAIAYNDSVVYVLGGSASGTAAADNLVYAYNIAGNTWTTESPKPTSSGWSMVNAVDGAIYVAYGSDCVTPTYLTNLDVGYLPPVGIAVIDLAKPKVSCRISPTVVRDLARISYSVAQRSRVELGIYDVTGKLVRTLVEGTVEPGNQSVVWNRTDNTGRHIASGTYFYRLSVDGKSIHGKAIVLK